MTDKLWNNWAPENDRDAEGYVVGLRSSIYPPEEPDATWIFQRDPNGHIAQANLSRAVPWLSSDAEWRFHRDAAARVVLVCMTPDEWRAAPIRDANGDMQRLLVWKPSGADVWPDNVSADNAESYPLPSEDLREKPAWYDGLVRDYGGDEMAAIESLIGGSQFKGWIIWRFFALVEEEVAAEELAESRALN